jgi:GH15 family glucan-1,4-alpha-glucosidase
MLKVTAENQGRYPAIGDYAFLSDCHAAALVSKTGSIDWCCMPRIDSGSIFGRLLDWEKGGHFLISPVARFTVKRRYLPGSLVLETTFIVKGGEARLLDFFSMHSGGEKSPYQQIIRLVEVVRGKVEFIVKVEPRFDYGGIRPLIRRKGEIFVAIGGSHGLLISGDIPLEVEARHNLFGRVTLLTGERRRLSIIFRRPEFLDEGEDKPPEPAEIDRRLEETAYWWREWSSEAKISGPYAGLLLQSAIVLKGLSYAPSGAIAAAATTSLPETPGGGGNWDYRYSWIRDSGFTIRSFVKLGFLKEADGYRRFIERSAAGSADELQVLYGVGGERRLHEYVISGLEGYRGARPVRVGNAASRQFQLDMYGALLNLAWRWHRGGQSPDDYYWEFLIDMVNCTCRLWRKPDRGIWEVRGASRHFVLSKVSCWSAIDRGIALAKELGRPVPMQDWQRECNEIRRTVEERGYDKARGIFISELNGRELDASLLLLPMSGFISFDDERMVRTTDAIRSELEEGGLLRRCSQKGDAREGVFLPCSFWLAECLAGQGRLEEAHEIFRLAVATGNDLGLFAEEFDVASAEMLGNFPQGLTHLSLISAGVAIAEREGL